MATLHTHHRHSERSKKSLFASGRTALAVAKTQATTGVL
jgi:hypothetical protein